MQPLFGGQWKLDVLFCQNAWGKCLRDFPGKKNGAYCWCTKSCTTKDDDYPIIYRILTIPFWVGVIFHDPFCLFKWMLGVLVLGVDETSTILAVSWSQCCSMGLEWPWILLRIRNMFVQSNIIYTYSDIPKIWALGNPVKPLLLFFLIHIGGFWNH